MPKDDDQTPFEFIESFPEVLKPLREDAHGLTDLYVVSAYSNADLDDTSLQTVERFWDSYERVRRSVVRRT